MAMMGLALDLSKRLKYTVMDGLPLSCSEEEIDSSVAHTDNAFELGAAILEGIRYMFDETASSATYPSKLLKRWKKTSERRGCATKVVDENPDLMTDSKYNRSCIYTKEVLTCRRILVL